MNAKRALPFLAAMVLCLEFSSHVFAANCVTDLAVDVTLCSDGTATIMQTWDTSFADGTECYFPVTNLGEMTIDNLIVSDESGRYQTMESWDLEASFEEKAGKCGLHPINGGYEVVWGLSRYGSNRYCVEYRLGGLVTSYSDYDGFLFQFVPSNMGTLPTNVTVRIFTQDDIALTAENAAIWAFGFDGQISFTQDGKVLADTETPLNQENESVIVMLQLQKGILAPKHTTEGSFETVKTRAFEESDYSADDAGEFGAFLLFVAPIIIGLWWWFGCAGRRRVKKLYQASNYYREVPLAGNLEATHMLARQFYQSDDDGNLIAATLIKLLAEGCLVPIIESDAGWMGREKEEVALRLLKAPTFRGVAAKGLYELLAQAADSNHLLQEQELERYCKSNYQAMLRIMREAEYDGKETLVGIGCYKSAMDLDQLGNLTERGREQLMHLMGLKKYLLDFSLIGERGVSEARIWQDYLTFSTLLGIADRVLKQLGKIYPDAKAYQQQAQTVYYLAYRYNRVTWQVAKSAENAAKRAAGVGGSSSSGGGGGFSGGGSGGGTR